MTEGEAAKMFKLHVAQTQHGDSPNLESGSGSKPHYVLIDGAPSKNFDDAGLRIEIVVTRHSIAIDLA